MSRRNLLIAAGTTSAFLAGALLWFFGASLAPTDAARNRITYSFQVEVLKPGELREYELGGAPLLVYRPTELDIENLKLLDGHVWHSKSEAFVPALNAYVYWGYSTKFGCKLQHIPPGKLTTALDRVVDWRGGYFDPCHDPSYDYAGRTIKTYEFTRNGYNSEYPNLYAPTVVSFSDRTIEIRPK